MKRGAGRERAADKQAGRTIRDLADPSPRSVNAALLAEDKTSREIGAALHIGHRKVEAHRPTSAPRSELQGSHALMRLTLDHKSEL